MRLNYTENPPTHLTGEDAEILKRVQDRRRAMGLPLIPLDLTLLHAPRIADGRKIHAHEGRDCLD